MRGYLRTQRGAIEKSFSSLDTTFFKYLCVDFLFYIFIAAISFPVIKYIRSTYDALDLPGTVADLAPENVIPVYSELIQFLTYSAIGIFVTLIFIGAFFGLFKGYITISLTKQPLKKKTMRGYAILNSLWFTLLFITFFALAFFIDPTQAPFFFLGVLFAFVYFTNTINVLFAFKPKLKSLFTGMKAALMALPSLLFCYVLSFIVFFALARFFHFLLPWDLNIITLFLYITILNVLRYYIVLSTQLTLKKLKYI